MRIDAHQHFWNYTPGMDWITDDMSVIRKDFFPADLLPLLQENDIDGCIAVQVDQTDQETKYLLQLAATYDFIKSVVGWIDLKAPDIISQLEMYQHYPALKGFRHILQSEPPEYMLQKDFLRGIGALQTTGFTYDILVYPHHLSAVDELIKRFPNQPFVIDHLAKPYISTHDIDGWKKDMQRISAYENVYCKVSGMLTEANWKQWRQSDLMPYLDVVAEAFGTKRLLFGSDWPVCLVAGSYQDTVTIVQEYFSGDELTDVMGENAIRFYNL